MSSKLTHVRSEASVEVVTAADASLVTVSGLIDERFAGFGDLGTTTCVVIDVSKLTRLTSFGVRQWIKALEGIPRAVTELYLVGCPTFFVDQLNMVLNFGGAAQILTVVAPYTCLACGTETGETIDLLAERANIAKGVTPEKACPRCAAALELDESVDSYFAFVDKYAASNVSPAAARLLEAHGRYTSPGWLEGAEKPAKIIKLVHGSVTYFRITGTIGASFRARPLLVGAEGEVVLDMTEVERFDPAAQKEWRRLLKTLASQVPSVTLVDIDDGFLAAATDSLTLARNIIVASVLVPYRCSDCGRTSHESIKLEPTSWPPTFAPRVCSTCGGASISQLTTEALMPLQKASNSVPAASAKVIADREEILSRAVTDAKVAQAGDSATAAIAADETILGKYKIVRRLSAGGMAEVFLANQVGIGGFEKPVALKRIQRKLLDSRQLAIDMFLNEAKIAGRLTHPNIVQVLDVGEVGGALYLAMEYVHGKDLRDVIKKLQQQKKAMPLGEACHIVREVAQALHHAYWSTDLNGKQLSVVHRDVSPHNVILGFDGSVKLLDFGVAMSAVTEHSESMVVGKWQYMSPEATANKAIDHRSDLFSLGVVFYLLCAGQLPVSEREPKAIVKKMMSGQYPPLEQVAAVPDQLARLVKRMMSPKPEQRPQRGQEVVTELSDIARQHGIGSSGPGIAALLHALFMDATFDRPGTGPFELTMRSREESKSPTPGSASRLSGPLDVSMTFPRRKSGEIPTRPTPSATPTPTPIPTAKTAVAKAPASWAAIIAIATALLLAGGGLLAYYFLG